MIKITCVEINVKESDVKENLNEMSENIYSFVIKFRKSIYQCLKLTMKLYKFYVFGLNFKLSSMNM